MFIHPQKKSIYNDICQRFGFLKNLASISVFEERTKGDLLTLRVIWDTYPSDDHYMLLALLGIEEKYSIVIDFVNILFVFSPNLEDIDEEILLCRMNNPNSKFVMTTNDDPLNASKMCKLVEFSDALKQTPQLHYELLEKIINREDYFNPRHSWWKYNYEWFMILTTYSTPQLIRFLSTNSLKLQTICSTSPILSYYQYWKNRFDDDIQ